MNTSINSVNALDIDDTKDVPASQEARIKELMTLPLSKKQAFVPPVGAQIKMGPFVYKITFANPSQLRFTATLSDVIIEGVNDGKSKVSAIINPRTGERIIKTDA
jgi:hypothetical protein